MHDLVVRDLEQARNRTLGLTDLDDPTLVTQHDPLMSPLVWDLAHHLVDVTDGVVTVTDLEA